MRRAAARMSSSHSVRAADLRRYARCIEVSRRVRWDIDRDVIRGRSFDLGRPFLPAALARLEGFGPLGEEDRRFVSQIQGRSYANWIALVERFLAAAALARAQGHALGNQTALEALVRFGDEELKHQALFHRLEGMLALAMPPGYRFVPEPGTVARTVLGRASWAVLAFACHIELSTLVHYEASIAGDEGLCALYRDVFLFHWKEEAQHASLDELEWVREDATLEHAARDDAVDDFIALVRFADGLLRRQAAADAAYFVRHRPSPAAAGQERACEAAFLGAYRGQHLAAGLRAPRFAQRLAGLVTEAQARRMGEAFALVVP